MKLEDVRDIVRGMALGFAIIALLCLVVVLAGFFASPAPHGGIGRPAATSAP